MGVKFTFVRYVKGVDMGCGLVHMKFGMIMMKKGIVPTGNGVMEMNIGLVMKKDIGFMKNGGLTEKSFG